MPKDELYALNQISQTLDKILKVLSIMVASQRSTTEGARALKLAGLDNQTIADLLNTSPATIRTLTSNLRTRS